MINDTPFLYDKDWVDHEVSYYEFNGMNLLYRENMYVKDFFVPFLVFQDKNGNKINPIIEGPYFNNRKNFNLRKNIKSYNLACIDIIEECKIKKIRKLKIHQPVVYRANTSICSLSPAELLYKSEIIYRNRVGIDLTYDIHKIKSNFRKSYKQLVNKEKSEKIEVYFGSIPDAVFGKFVDKHFFLAGRKTKSDICWDILKKFIKEEKAILVSINNDFLFFFTSKDYSYYGISAAAPENSVGHKLMWRSIQWLNENGFLFLDLGANYLSAPEKCIHASESYDIDKLIKISFFKSGFANVHSLDVYSSFLLK
jgi:hypothetical protein